MSTTQTDRRGTPLARTNGATRTPAAPRPARPIFYPESDGKPMAETGRHVFELLRLLATLMAWYGDEPLVLVGSNQFLYYEEGNPRKSVAPDLYLTKGILKEPPRNTYRLWVEGLPPTFVIEVTSPKTRREDQVKKRAIYEQMGVAEYVLYDPFGEYLRPPLQALRLGPSGYEPMAQDRDGAFLSDALGLRLVLEGGRLQFYDQTSGQKLLNPPEQAELEREQARVAADQARVATEQARLALERAGTEARRAEAEAGARRAAEAEAAALRTLLHELQPPQRSAALPVDL